eukprot:scaffold91028_cov46-Prasinocladus_malaysianus.AAC.1
MQQQFRQKRHCKQIHGELCTEQDTWPGSARWPPARVIHHILSLPARLELCGRLWGGPFPSLTDSDSKLTQDLRPGDGVQVGPPDVGLETPGPGLLQVVRGGVDGPVYNVDGMLGCPLGVALLHVSLYQQRLQYRGYLRGPSNTAIYQYKAGIVGRLWSILSRK